MTKERLRERERKRLKQLPGLAMLLGSELGATNSRVSPDKRKPSIQFSVHAGK